MTLEGFAVLDEAVTPHVRVRRWQHRFGPTCFAPNHHAEVELAWIESGWACYRTGGRDIRMEPNQAIFVPAGIDHATEIENGTRASSVWLSLDLLTEVAASLGRELPSEVRVVEDAAPFAAIGSLLQSEAASHEPGKLLAVDALSRALAVALVRAVTRQAKHAVADPRIVRALAMIEERYAEPLGVDELARAANTSRFHFSRMFKDAVGLSPYRYLTKTRVLRAAELLRDGGHGVTEAALCVGFHDLGRFSRAFREELGMTPSELARNARRSARYA